ncbi:MAG: YbgC/FadM family acyl-CoA thioesterase [Pseudomonadota bacterium]
MIKQDFRFFHALRVRWAEVDMQKIVFNAHYLMYLDTAISDYWRALALPYEEAMREWGGDLYVKKASVEYSGSARFDDRLDVALKCKRIGNSSMAFAGAIFRGHEQLITAELVYVFADSVTQKPKAVPESLRGVLERFEAGGEMSRLQLGQWNELCDDAAKLRTEVFIQEQAIPVEMEWDEADALALHAVAYNHAGMAVATGRLIQHSPGVGRIGRMAVKRALRGARLGRNILHALTEAARERGDRSVMLHAQRSAEGFYSAYGFEPRGKPFDEAGIPHIEMFKGL